MSPDSGAGDELYRTFQTAWRLLGEGDAAGAERIGRSILSVNGRYFPALLVVGLALEGRGAAAEAIDFYERGAAVNPGHGLPFTRLAALKFRRRHGMPPSPRPPAASRRIQSTTLGMQGRFGNQLIQYGFVRLYAAEHGLTAEFPDWIGRDLYDLDDPFPSAPLPLVTEDRFDLIGSLRRTHPQVLSEVDVAGYFAVHTGALADRRERWRDLFRPGRRVAPVLEAGLARLAAPGRTVVAVHQRYGDFGSGKFWIAPPEWYDTWLEAIWPALNDPVLYVASDEPERAVAGLARYRPVTARALGVEISGAEFLFDHHVLASADRLAIANNSFSFTAALLNRRATEFVRPDSQRRGLVSFDPWDAEVFLREPQTDIPPVEA